MREWGFINPSNLLFLIIHNQKEKPLEMGTKFLQLFQLLLWCYDQKKLTLFICFIDFIYSLFKVDTKYNTIKYLLSCNKLIAYPTEKRLYIWKTKFKNDCY